MSFQIDTASIIRELDEHTFDKGADVRRSGLVRRVESNPDGSRISGSVSGSKRAPYSQSIMLNERNGRLRITGYCTCPMAFNCKHVAAVLIDLVERGRDEQERPPAVPDPRQREPMEEQQFLLSRPQLPEWPRQLQELSPRDRPTATRGSGGPRHGPCRG